MSFRNAVIVIFYISTLWVLKQVVEKVLGTSTVQLGIISK